MVSVRVSVGVSVKIRVRGLEINDDLRKWKQMLGKETTKPTKLFKDIYARVYKDHYQEIKEQIEAFAIYGTPIQKKF